MWWQVEASRGAMGFVWVEGLGGEKKPELGPHISGRQEAHVSIRVCCPMGPGKGR